MNTPSKLVRPVLIGLGLLLVCLGLFGLRLLVPGAPTSNAPPLSQIPWRLAVPGDTLEPGWSLAFDLDELSDPSFVIPPRSENPNGGLAIDEKSLWWGDVWETDQFLQRDIVLKNPSGRDLHVVFKQTPCGSHVHPDELTVPARGQATLRFGVLPSTRNPASREKSVELQKRLVPVITEYPGRHPGWVVRCHVTRAMAVDELADQEEHYLVTPLRDIAFVTADIDGDRSGITIEGPDASSRYLVRLDPRLQPVGPRRKLVSIRGRFAFGGSTERIVYIDPVSGR